jgi:hypothetical protein
MGNRWRIVETTIGDSWASMNHKRNEIVIIPRVKRLRLPAATAALARRMNH